MEPPTANIAKLAADETKGEVLVVAVRNVNSCDLNALTQEFEIFCV
jgi:hypothetical protein